MITRIMLLCIAASQAAAQPGPIAIRGGTVIPVTGPSIANGTVLLRHGKIVALGAGLAVPPDAQVVDATGKYVLPGLVDAMTYFGIAPAFLNDDEPVTPELQVLHGYAPWRRYTDTPGPVRVTELLAGGVTTQYVGPGDASVVAGQGAVVKTAGSSYADLVLRNPAAIDMAVGERPARIFRMRGRVPASRQTVIETLRGALRQAQDYGRHRAVAHDPGVPPVPEDPRMEALLLLLNRRLPARIQANQPKDIRDAIALSREFGFDLVLEGGNFAHTIASEIAKDSVPMVLGPISRSYAWTQDPADPEEFPDPEERAPALLARAGVKLALASFARGHYAHSEAVTGKWLLLDAMLASAYGLREDAALRAVTMDAAEILGVGDRVGSLEPGKDADVIILSGPPRSVLSVVERVFVGGYLVYTTDGKSTGAPGVR